MIEGAFTYPTEREDWARTVLIGGVLTFLAFLVVPLFATYGYAVRAVRDTANGEAHPPAFEDWWGLLVEGFRAWLVGVVYLLVPAVVAAVTVGGSIGALVAGDGGGVAGLFGGFALTGVLALLFGYAAVAAVVNFACEGRFGAAFDPGALRDLVFDVEFAMAWVASVIAASVASFLGSVVLIGWLLAPFLGFYALVVAARLWGGGYREATGAAGPDGAPSA